MEEQWRDMAGSKRRRILVGAETKGGGAGAGASLQLAGVETKGGGAGVLLQLAN
jgi:hypothetical protein